MVVELFDIGDVERMREARAIRMRVFVDEQRVPPEEEIDEHDRTDTAACHALARDAAGRALGTARFYVLDARTARIGRMAVSAHARGRGVGMLLLQRLGTEAFRRGFAAIELHAQVHAREFYVRAGYVDDGARNWDAGIEHQPMRLDLTRMEAEK